MTPGDHYVEADRLLADVARVTTGSAEKQRPLTEDEWRAVALWVGVAQVHANLAGALGAYAQSVES